MRSGWLRQSGHEAYDVAPEELCWQFRFPVGVLLADSAEGLLRIGRSMADFGSGVGSRAASSNRAAAVCTHGSAGSVVSGTGIRCTAWMALRLTAIEILDGSSWVFT